MSDWIHSYTSLRSHPKALKLARRVGGIKPAIGLLHCLWWWSVDYAKDGDLERFSPEDLAVACAWDGDGDELITHLIACGWLDPDPLRIHDHYEYIGRFLEARAADAERKRDARRRDVQGTSGGRDASVQRTADVEREEREREKKERKNGRDDASDGKKPSSRPVDKPGPTRFNVICYVCGEDIVDRAAEDGPGKLRHETCAPRKA